LFNIEKYAPNIKDSWDNLKPNDNLYLLGIQMEADVLAATDKSLPTTGDGYKKKFGIKYIRGCQVHELLDDQGAVVLDYKVAQVLDEKGQAPIVGGSRTMRVLLDPNQYLADSKACKDIYDVYGCLNIVLKRSSDSNFYKSILETLRGLISSDFVFPDWLSNTLLGYKSKNATLTDSESGRIIGNTYDTILDWKHLQSSFPDVVLCFKLENNQQKKP
jgi:intron-binding protein aquarius